MLAGTWPECTSEHGTCCLHVDQMINLGCMFASVKFHIGGPFHGQLTTVKTRHPTVEMAAVNMCGLQLPCNAVWKRYKMAGKRRFPALYTLTRETTKELPY